MYSFALSRRLFMLPLLALMICAPAHAQVKLAGAAKKLDENRYRLTRELPSTAGAVWSENTIDLNDPFEINFDVFLGCGNNDADGVAFVLQQKGNKALGQIGSGIGYKGISPSLVVEFDNYLNEFESFFPSSETHVAIVKNGDNNHLSSNNLAGPVAMSPQKMGSSRQCKYHQVSVSWDPASQIMDVYVDDVFTLSWTGDMVKSVFNGKPNVYWGFTAATSKTRINAQGVLLKFKPLSAELSTTSVLCPGGNEGSISAKVKGGIGKYIYKWSNGSNARAINKLAPGKYTLTVTDNWGNRVVETASVIAPANLQVTDVVKIDVNELYNWKCNASGGTPPYTFQKGYAVLEGEAARKPANFNTHGGMQKAVPHVYETEGIDRLNAYIERATEQKPVAVVGFITVVDANGCSATQYLPFATRTYPLPQPPETVTTIAPLTIDTAKVNNPTDTPTPPTVTIANADTSQPILPTILFDLDNPKLVYTERNVPAMLNNRTVKTGKRIFIENEKIEIQVWDDEYEDGDTISIYYNGEWLLREYRLKKKPRKVDITVDRNADNYLILYAHNEGTRPPNTAALIIKDGKSSKRIALSSGLNYCDALNFKFKDE